MQSDDLLYFSRFKSLRQGGGIRERGDKCIVETISCRNDSEGYKDMEGILEMLKILFTSVRGLYILASA